MVDWMIILFRAPASIKGTWRKTITPPCVHTLLTCAPECAFQTTNVWAESRLVGIGNIISVSTILSKNESEMWRRQGLLGVIAMHRPCSQKGPNHSVTFSSTNLSFLSGWLGNTVVNKKVIFYPQPYTHTHVYLPAHARTHIQVYRAAKLPHFKHNRACWDVSLKRRFHCSRHWYRLCKRCWHSEPTGKLYSPQYVEPRKMPRECICDKFVSQWTLTWQAELTVYVMAD